MFSTNSIFVRDAIIRTTCLKEGKLENVKHASSIRTEPNRNIMTMAISTVIFETIKKLWQIMKLLRFWWAPNKIYIRYIRRTNDVNTIGQYEIASAYPVNTYKFGNKIVLWNMNSDRVNPLKKFLLLPRA